MGTRIINKHFPVLDIKLFLFLIYISLIPFYLFPSGEPQPSDYLMTILMLIVFFDKNSNLGKKYVKFYIPLLLFVYYTTMLNSVWVVITGEIEFLKSSLFYVYNCLIFIFIIKLYTIYGKAIFSIILLGLIISAILETAVLLGGYDITYRSIGSFNNPNQLGYYSVVSFSIFSIIAKDFKLNFFFEIFMVFIFLFIVALSLSKAALVAILFNIIFVFFKNIKYTLLLFVCFLAVFFITNISNPFVMRLDSRIRTFGVQQDDSLIGRAYDRIWENPEYLFFGAGEGLNKRFSQNGIGKEIHSSFGAIFFSYGILGLILFLSFLYLIYKNTVKEYFVFLLPSFLYGITHQGLRFTLFWILLSVLVIKGSSCQYIQSNSSL